jgi:hypothetical protein
MSLANKRLKNCIQVEAAAARKKAEGVGVHDAAAASSSTATAAASTGASSVFVLLYDATFLCGFRTLSAQRIVCVLCLYYVWQRVRATLTP